MINVYFDRSPGSSPVRSPQDGRQRREVEREGVRMEPSDQSVIERTIQEIIAQSPGEFCTAFIIYCSCSVEE